MGFCCDFRARLQILIRTHSVFLPCLDYQRAKKRAEHRDRPQSLSEIANHTTDDSAPLLTANIDRLDTDVYGATSQDPHRSTTPAVRTQVEPPSILLRLLAMFKWEVLAAMLIKCISDLLIFANPQLLRWESVQCGFRSGLLKVSSSRSTRFTE